MNRKERRELGERGPQHPTVELAYLTAGRPCDSFMASVIRCRDYELIRTHQLIGVRSRRARSGAIAKSRNELTAMFMHAGAEWLWFVDDDMGFPKTALHQLLDAADPDQRPIMAALCFAHRTEGYDEETNAEIFGMIPTLSVWAYNEDGTVIGWKAVEDYPRDTVCKVQATGAACVLIHRSVVIAMYDKYGFNWWTQIQQPGSDGTFGEDTSFYLRAHELDVPVYTGVKTSHDKGGIFLTQEAWDAQQLARQDVVPLVRYIAAVHHRVPRPFHYRWLLPKLCGDKSENRWRYQSQIATLSLPLLTWWYVSGRPGVAAGLMVIGLAGVWRFNRRFPILVDAAGMSTALLSADLFRHHLWPLGIAAALVAGCVRETSPIMAALYAWNPLALLGLVPVAVRSFQREGPDPEGNQPWRLANQLRTCLAIHRTQPVGLFILPWGVGLLCLANGSWQLWVTLTVCYLQLAVATDTVRLYQWAFPVVLASAVHAVPLRWLPVLVAVQIGNPFLSEGG